MFFFLDFGSETANEDGEETPRNGHEKEAAWCSRNDGKTSQLCRAVAVF